MSLDEFLERANEEIDAKALESLFTCADS